MKQLYPALILVLITCFSAMGQSSVGINTSTPNTKSVLELVSPNNNQGFLVPRISSAQRNAMPLTISDRGMMVYDINLNQFWHWDGGNWKAGLGVLGETAATGDLNGTFPEVYINDDAVGTDELTDVATAGTYGDDSTILEVTIDVDGRVNSVVEKNVVVRSGNIVDASILNSDLANTTITIAKLNAEGEADKVLATDPSGVVYWEDKSAFTSSSLPTDYIYIGDASGVAQGLPVSGDVSVTDAGTAADIQLKTGVVTSIEIEDESIQSVDIMDLTVAEADIAAAAVTEQKLGDDAVTAAKINPDVAGEALIPNTTTGALDVNAGNGLLVASDSVEIDLQDIDGEGIVADLVDKELDVNVDNSTLIVDSDVLRVNDLGITNDEIAFGTINAEAKISNINFNTGFPFLNRILIINGASEVDWTSIGLSSVLATTSSGDIVGKPLTDFATNSLPTGSIFLGDGAGNAQPLFAGSANQVLVGNGVGLSSVPLIGDVNITATDGTVAIQDNAVQGNDIDATNNDLNIAGTELISMTTSVVSGQAIQLNASAGGIDIGGNQGIVIDADNNNVDIDAIAGSINIDANQNITLTSNNVALNPVTDATITTTSGDIVFTSGDGVTITGATASSFTTSAGDIDINAAGQLNLNGGTTVAIEGATGVTVRSTANDVDIIGDDNANITSLNAEVGITGATNVDIDASAGNVTINAAGAGNDVILTAPDQVEFNGTNTQVVSGTFELANGGIQVDEIVDDATVDLATPSDNKLITETALATAIGNQAGSGLSYDALNQEIDLGGTLDQTADLVTAAGVNLQVSGVGILDVDTDVDILGDITLSGVAQSVTHTGATSLGVVSNTAPITIDALGNTLTMDGDQGVSVDAASNNIDVTAATGLVNVTGNQGVNIDATNNNLSLDAIAGTLVLDGNSGVNIDASTSGDVSINSAAGSVSIDGAEAIGDAVSITASDVTGGIDLTAGTGGIAAVATDGDVSLTSSSTGDVILSGADDVTVTGGTNVTTTATAGTATLAATAGEVDLTAGTTVDINAAGGNVTIDAAGAGNDVILTAPDQVEFNGTNTQVVSGTFELANGGIQVDEIVDDITVDLSAPSDNKLVTETALATAIGNQAGSGLTYDAVNQEIDLGGTLDQTADLVTAAGVNLQVSGVGILDVDTDVDILGNVTLSGAAQSLTHTGATSLGILSNTAPITIDALGNTLTLDGDQGVSVDAASNDIDVTAATGVVNVTGNQGVNIDATNNNLSLDAIAGTLVLDGNSGVSIDASTSGDVSINSVAGSVSIDGAEAIGDAVSITASDVTGGIDLTAGTGGIAAVATDGDVSLTSSSTGDVILSGAEDVTVTGGTNVTTTATAGTATLAATAGEVDLSAGTTVDINAAGGNVTIDAAGAGNDVILTAPDQVEFNAANTQVVSGTFELANGGIQVDEIVDDITVDLSAPSDNKLVTETALATAIGNQAGSGLTYDAVNQEIDLGGTLDQTADLVTAAGVNLQVSGVGILDVDTDVDILGNVTLSGAAQSLTHTGATSLGILSNTAPITIDALGNTLTLDGDQGVSVDAASNDIDVTAATGVVNVTGNQGVNIDATNNNLSLDAIAGTLALDGNSGVNIDASTSGDVAINSAAGSVSIDGAEAIGDAVSITASDVTGGIDLTAGTGGIAAVATDGDVSLTSSSTGDVILSGAEDVTVTGGTNVTTTATAGTATLAATAGEVDLTAGTTVDINAAGGNVTIDAVGAGNDIILTAPDQIQFNGTNTQVVSGTFQLANGTVVADEIVDDVTVDVVTAPSDTKLVTESALASVTSGQAGSGLTFDLVGDDKIDLGGTLGAVANIVTGGTGENLQVSGAGILDVDTDVDILGDVTLSGAAQNLTHTGATSLGIVSSTAPVTIDAQGNVLALDGNSGVSIDASTSGDVSINSVAGSVSIDGAEAIGDAVSITASDVTGGIDLTAGTGGIAAVATDGDVSLTSSSTGDVILSGADDVTVTGGTNVTTTATAGTATLAATAGEVDLTAGTTVDINAAGGNVTIDAVGAGNDIILTAPDQIQFNGTNTQVVSGTFQLANGTVVADEIVDDVTVDVVTAPSDTKLVTESALASVTSGQAGSGLTFDLVGDDKIDLGGTLGAVANIVTGGTGENLQVSGAGILDVDTDVDILGDVTLSGAAQSLTHTGATSLGIVSNTAPITIDALGNTLTLDGDQGVSVDAASNDIDVTAATGVVNVTGNQGVNIDATNNNLSLDAIAGTLVLDGNSGVNVAGNGNEIDLTTAGALVDINAGSIEADITGGISLDAAGASNFNTTGTNTLTLGTAGDAQTIISSAGTTASALDLNATAGGVDIDANSTVTVDGASGVTIDAAANDVEINAAAGAVSLANDANDGAVNIGTSTTNGRTITIGNSTLATGLVLNAGTAGVTGSSILDEDNMISDSDVRLATQQSIKAYVDTQVGNQDLQAAYDDGNAIVTSGGNALDISGTEAISLDAQGASNFTVDGNTLTLSTITSGIVTIDGVDGVNVAGNGNEIDLTTAGALVDINAGSIEADITGGISLDAAGASNFNTTGTNTLTLGTAGDAQTIISSAGTTASALDLNATAGGVDIDANSTVTVDGASGVTIDAAANDVEINAAAGAVSLANDANDGAVNIGTSTTNGRTITIGNSTLATGLVLNAGTAGVTGSSILDEDNMISDSDVRLATQQSIKAYVDTQVGNQDLQAAYDDGNAIVTSGGNALDISGTEAISLDAQGASNFTVDGNTLTLSTITSGIVTIDGVDGVNVAGNGNEIDLTTAGALVDINAGSIEADITGGISLDAAGASNFNTTGTNTLTLGTAGDAQTIISSAGTTASALDLNATAGGVDIDANSTVTVDGASGVTIDAAANDVEINAAAGAVSLANDANDGAVNIGTSTTNGRTITIGNSTLATGLVLNAGTAGVTGSSILDEDNMISDSDVRLATQQSIKAYVDTQVGNQDLQAAYDDGNAIVTSGGNALDISGTEAISLDAQGASNFTVDGNTLTLSTITSGIVTIDGVDGVNVAGNGNEIDLTTAGALVDINAGSIEADITGGISLDAAGASNFNTTGTNTLTLGTAGDAQTIISSAGTTASALDLNATAGGVDIDANSTVTVDGASGVTIDAAANDVEINAAAGAVSLANDANDGAVNIGTSTTNGRTITIGNSTLATGLVLNAGTAGVTGSSILDEDNMISDSDVRLATQQSIKAYVDTQVGNQDLQAAYDDGNAIVTSGGNALDISGTEAISLDAQGASNFTVDGNTLTLSTITSGIVTIDGVDGVNVAGNGNEIDLTTAGALVDINAGSIEADITGGISLDAAGASNFNTTGTNTLTLGTAGDAQTIISSAGTTASALDLNATAGGVDIDANSTVTVDGASGVTIDAAANDVEINAAAGAVSLANDANDGAVNIGTSTTNGRTITIGNSTLATGLVLNAGTAGVTGSSILDEDNMISDSDVRLATQQSIKAYVDTQVGNQDLQAAYDDGNAIVTSGGNALDISGTEAISLDAQGASNFTVDGNTLTLSTITSGIVTIDGVDGVNVAGNGNEIDLTTAGALVDINAGSIEADITGGISLDAAGASNFNTTGTNTLTLGTAGDAQTIISSAGTTASALDLNATAGGVDIDGATGVTVDAGVNQNITLTTSGTGRVVIPLVDINGGTIDGTDVNMTGQTLTLDNDAISGDKVEGGTIAGITITSASIGSLGSALDANSQAITNVDINSGTIDGTTITQTDNLFTLQDDGNNTRQAQFELGSITAGQTRVYTLPDASGTIQLVSGPIAANRAVVTDGSGQLAASAVLDTEIDYLDLTAGPGTAEANKALVANGTLDIAGINVLSADQVNVNNVSLDGNTVSSTAGVLTMSATTIADIDGATGVTIDAAANDIDINSVAGQVDIDGGTLVTVDGGTGVQITSTANDVDISAAALVDLDGATGVIIDAAANNIAINAANGALDLDATSGNISLTTNTSGIVDIDGVTGVQINSIANDVDIASAATVDIDGATGVTVDAAANDIDINAAAGEVDIDANTTVDVNANDGTTINSSSTTNTSLTVNGGMTFVPSTYTIIADGATITVGNSSFIAITDTHGGGTDFSLSNGLADGHKLVLLMVSANGGVRLNDNDGNTALDGNWDPDDTDTISLIWYGTSWYEVGRSVNN